MVAALLTIDQKIAMARTRDDAPQFSGWMRGRYGRSVTISKPPCNS
jgi:hypothetical protein